MRIFKSFCIVFGLAMAMIGVAQAGYPACSPKPTHEGLPAYNAADGGYGQNGFKYQALAAVPGGVNNAKPCLTPQSGTPTNPNFNNKRCDTNYRALYGCSTPW